MDMGKTFEKRPILGASVLVRRDSGHILLVKRLNEPGKLSWAFPGGKVEYGETVERCAVREIKEETSIDVKLKGLLGPYDIISENYHYVTVCFMGDPQNTDVVPGPDVGEARWFPIKGLEEVKLTPSTRRALEDAGVLREVSTSPDPPIQ